MITLLRHGETEDRDGFYGSTDSRLTPEGVGQMLAQLRGQSIDALIASPRQRCAQVAQHWSQRIGCPYYVYDDLREYHFGDWEARRIADLWETEPDALALLWQNPHQFTPPNAEPFADFLARVATAREQLMRWQAQYEHLWVVTHAGVIRALRVLSGQNTAQDWLTYPVAHASQHLLCPTTHHLHPQGLPDAS